MPGPAVTVEIRGDTSSLDTALTESKSGLDTFKAGISSFLSGIGGVAGAVDLAVQGFDKLIELGGPEAKAALDDIAATFGEAMAPALEELAPHIVKLVEGLGKLLDRDPADAGAAARGACDRAGAGARRGGLLVEYHGGTAGWTSSPSPSSDLLIDLANSALPSAP